MKLELTVIFVIAMTPKAEEAISSLEIAASLRFSQ
jgi:hypothetical protein